MKVANRLNHEKFYALVQWVASNGERLMKERPAYKHAAAEAAKAIGVEGINEGGAFRQACRLAAVDWTSNDCKRTYPRITKQDFDAIKARLATAEADLAIMRGLIHHLYRDLNTSPPNGYILPSAQNGELRITPHKAAL